MKQENFPDFLASLREGKDEAWRRLLDFAAEELRPPLRVFLRRVSAYSAGDSTDAVASAISRVWLPVSKGREFNTLDDLLGFVLTCAFNSARNKARARARQGNAAPPSENTPAADLSPSEEAVNQDALQAIEDRLPPDLRRVFRLRVENLEYSDIVERLGLPRGTEHRLRGRYRHAALRAMEDLGFFED